MSIGSFLNRNEGNEYQEGRTMVKVERQINTKYFPSL